MLSSRLRTLVRAAAARGVCGAEGIPDMTPAQADALLSAHEANRRAAMGQADAHAWMTGYYVLRALHAPRRYPPSPCLVREDVPGEAMSEEAMKAALAGYAKGGKT